MWTLKLRRWIGFELILDSSKFASFNNEKLVLGFVYERKSKLRLANYLKSGREAYHKFKSQKWLNKLS